MEDRPSYRAGELLQTAATVAAIALALASLIEDQGPVIRGYHFLPLTFLLAGFFAVAGSLYAMDDLVKEAAGGNRSQWHGYRLLLTDRETLFFTMWGLRVVGVAYLWLLFDGVP